VGAAALPYQPRAPALIDVGVLNLAVAGGGLRRSFELFDRRLRPALAEMA